jgi:D-alanyl-lipoteichoic acid acyltransferase DltB (MBOAT superfamily)
MLLLSFGYLIFLLVVVVTYFLVSDTYKIYVLFFTSLVFIASFSIGVAFFSLLFTIVNYFWGIMLEKYNNKPALKNKLFWFVILSDICILALFKYFNGYLNEINYLFFNSGIYSETPYLKIMIPLGISYYTFQCLSYLIRIDRGSEKAQRHFASFGTYLLFFPKFLAGPVERSNHFFPQIINPARVDMNQINEGLRLFLWGLFKKVVIADTLYLSVSTVYQDVYKFSGLQLFTVLIVETIYIYCDFSGYTDMALGSAKLLGINLMDNFNRPFLSKNVSEFWRRWHISLSSWCNDFIYNPFIIKFRRFGNVAVTTGIFLTFFIVGIWHGANLTFVILGLLQAIAIIYEFYTKRYRLKFASRYKKSTVNTVSRIIVFFYMAFSMVFFFSNTIFDAWYFISHIFRNIHLDIDQFSFITNQPQFFFALFCFLIIFIIEIFNEKGKKILPLFLKQPVWLRWISYLVCIVLIYLFHSGIQTFYYMRF